MHKNKIQKVEEYIRNHLENELTLENLSKQACMSPFHFQRIFKKTIGETPRQYINRIRLETAAHQIVLNPALPLLTIAWNCGYKSLESFSRAFKKYYTISPNIYRKMPEFEKLKITNSKNIENKKIITGFFKKHPGQKIHSHKLSVSIKRIPSQKLIFLPSILGNPKEITENFQHIKQWAKVRDLYTSESKLFGLIVDYPFFTTLNKCRYLVCCLVEKKPDNLNRVHYMELPAMTCALFETSGEIKKMINQITLFWKTWLPESGYELIHQPALHASKFDISRIPFHKNLFQIHIAIQPK